MVVNKNSALKLPSFPCLLQNGQSIQLNEQRGQKIILYFYPKDSTPGCTLQAQQFTKLKDQFAAINTMILGVSRDSTQSHNKFIDKCELGIDLISDTDEKLCQHFDVIKEKNMYGKKVLGIERSTFVFDEQGNLIHEMRAVKADGHAQTVLDLLKS